VSAVFSLSPTTAATISSEGVLSANAVDSFQTVTVNASYTQDGITRNATMSVQIIPPATLTGLTIQGAASVNADATSTYTATAWYSDGSWNAVNAMFSLSTTTAATISSDGILSAAAVTANQTVTVNASYTEGNVTQTTSIDVAIIAPGWILRSLTIQGAASVNADTTSKYTATATYNDGSSRTVSAAFSLSATTFATITSDGVLSAGLIPSNQTVTINAYYTEGGITQTASMDVQIVGRLIPISLTIQGAASVNSSATSTYTATASYDDGSSKAVNAAFSLSATTAATISSDGTLTAGVAANGATVTVNASYTESGVTVNASMQVTINPQGVLGLNRSFNSFGELDSEQTEISGQNIYSYALTRDKSGSIATRTETLSGISSQYTYSYDSLGRLTSVTQNGLVVEEYQYGPNGTRTYEQNALRGIPGRTLSYSEEDHLLSAGDTTYQYDVDGFLTTRTSGSQVTSYTYSSRGELLSVNLPDGRLIEYVCDPLGRRIAKKINGTIVEKYLWQGRTRLLAVYDGNDNLLMRFMYADARTPLAMTKEGLNYYLCYDQAGSLRTVADTLGNIVKELDYDSFGNVLLDSDPTFTVPFAFAGGLFDPDTGLVRFGARDYDPDTGRWTAKDPIGFAGGDSNLYGYVQNNPVNWIDPLGLYIGQYPPPPPGYDPNTWSSGQWDNGNWFVKSPDNSYYTAHPEDAGHWRHWDVQKPGGKGGGQCPPDSGKPWPTQGDKLKDNQSPTDPNGNAPEWVPPFIPFWPIDPIMPMVPIFEGVPILEPIVIF
jgi:RHS repeat-associated protein